MKRCWVPLLFAMCACSENTPPDPLAEFDRIVVFTATTAPSGQGCEPRDIDGQFRVSPLFATSAAAPFPSTSRLSAYCQLERVDPSVDWPSVEAVTNVVAPAFSDPVIDADPIGLVQTTAQYGGLVDSTWTYHYPRFMTAVGAVDVSSVPRREGPLPRIVLIDSAPTSDVPEWLSVAGSDAFQDHGYALARLMEELLCVDVQGENNDGCLAEIVSVRAMQPVGEGELRGALGGLAEAIVQAVEDAGTRPLIINLSLGWVNPMMGGDRGDIVRFRPEVPAAAAVHEALQYARCRGAAIFTAAGNRVGAFDGRYEEGPIRPSHWSQDQFVDATVCLDEFGLSNPLMGTVPLVTAIGAVGDGAQRLGVYRNDSEPNLVANGMAVVVPTQPNSGRPTALLSGSSASVAVASALLAALYSGMPDGTPQSIESSLRQWAPAIAGRTAIDGSAVHLLHMHEVLETAIGPNVVAPRSFVVPGWPAPPANRQSLGSMTSTCTIDGVPILVQGAAAVDSVCDGLDWESIDERPSTHPQPLPGGGGCPGCVLNLGSDAVTFEVSPESSFDAAFVEVADAAGVRIFAVPPGLSRGIVYELPLNGLRGAPETTARMLMIDPADQTTVGVEMHVF